MIRLFLLAGFALSITSAFYSSRDNVVELTDSNFETKVINSNNVWLVEFFAPWCGHCQSLVPEYIKAAAALQGVAKVGALNADEQKTVASRYGIRGFPTIKIFGADKSSPIDYNSKRTAKGMTDAMLDAIKDKVNSHYGDSGKSSSGSKSSDAVVELTEDNFDKLVLQSEEMWLVEFFAPWCGHCKSLAPHWAEAAAQLKGKVKLGALDATAHGSKAAEYGVQGYPTIKYFPAGKKRSSSAAEEYDGGRTASDIVAWALDKYEMNIASPEIVQITNENVVSEACGKHALCVIAVLPHILDCQSECRNSYLSTLKTVSEKFKRQQWGWIWSEAGSQQSLESAMEIGGFGYPALVLLNQKKMKYSVLRGAFSENGISEFLRDVSYGRGATAVIASMPKIDEVQPWDGKDGEQPVEEDIDLSDVELDPVPPKQEL